MPIVPGNDPRQSKKTGGFGVGWIIPLLVLGPPVYRFIRAQVAGRITDQQLLIIGAGVIGLVVLAAIVQRINRMRSGTTSSLPTSYQPSSIDMSASRAPTAMRDVRLPQAPRFEPIITGKVMLAGFILALLLGGIGLLLILNT